MKSPCRITPFPALLIALAMFGAQLPGVRAQSSTNWNTLTNWTQTAAPSAEWQFIASSADGSKLVALVYYGGIYTSTDAGVTWTQSSAPIAKDWYSASSSADGTKLAAVNVDGEIHVSTNSGASWTQTSAPAQLWFCIASSADGTILAAGALDGGIYISTNSGATWTQSGAPNQQWNSIASSSDGTKLAAVVYAGGIYTSTNAGATWTQTGAPTGDGWNSIASSSDGTKLAAAFYNSGGGLIYTSTNGGVTWTATSAPVKNWQSVCSSSDATKLAAVANGDGIYISTNSGANWTPTSAPNAGWYSIAGSSDGTKLAAAVYAGGIYTAQATIQTTGGPALGIVTTNNQVLLFWSTNSGGVNGALQSTTNLAPPNWVWTTDVMAANYAAFFAVATSNSPPARFFRLTLVPPATDGMAFIPAGSFTMGDTLDAESDAIPTNIYVSAFYMDTNLVSYSQWQTIYTYATGIGYGFNHLGAGKAANHPVQSVDWFDAVKWCNARSQLAGLTPVYYTDAGFTEIYTNGEVVPFANWAANGYRLPTEAEWEKAARGGRVGQRFPRGNTISESLANYYGDTVDYSYDLGPNGYNPVFATGGQPYTSTAGYFPANGYGLYDMAGNVEEWCWDWWGKPYGQPTTTDPTGPATGVLRIMRGGDFYVTANHSRCAYRNSYVPGSGFSQFGFRCVRGN
jgi:formylglycine-generating enzyme required for sulfatase activity